MFPVYPADKKLEAGDKNPVLEDPTEFETEAENEDWLVSDEESTRTENGNIINLMIIIQLLTIYRLL